MQKYKPSPKAKAKAKTMAKAMPKPTMPKAKAVAKPKPTAQSVAKQRAEMLKKLSPAMREMKMGSKMVKCADGTGKVKAPSMAAKRASTMVEPKRKVDATKTMDKFKLDSLNNVDNTRIERRVLIDKKKDNAVKNRKLSIIDQARIKSGQLDLEKNAEINAKRKADRRNKEDAQLNSERNAIIKRQAEKAKRDAATLEKATGKMSYGTKGVKKMAMGMAEMPMGSKGVSGKYPDGTKKVKAPSTEMRGDKTATANTKRTDLRLNETEWEYYNLQNKRNKEREERKGFNDPNGISIGYNDFGIDTEAKKAAYDKARIEFYESTERDKDEETRQKQNALGTRFKKRNEAMKKLSSKMSYGTKSVSKMKMGSKKVC